MVYYLVDREETREYYTGSLKRKYIRTDGHTGNKLDMLTGF
ncbi:hypothetical protein [Chryseobacterium carnipullorum]|nr:hypothetical protein [Chryseobacterium carnipullorum]